MSAVVIVAVLGCVPLSMWLGVYIGRSWSSLPTLAPHSVVAFRGPSVGVEHRFTVSEIQSDMDGMTVVLRAPAPTTERTTR